LAVRIFGSQILVTRALTTACFTSSTVLGWLIARRCGLGRLGRGLLVVALLAYASPLTNFVSFYSVLAVTFALGALLLLLGWVDWPSEPPSRRLVMIGALAGLSFAAKPNVGVAAAAAVLVVVFLRPGPTRWRDAARALTPALAIAAVVVGVVAATGSTAAFASNVFSGKSDYLDTFTGGYLPGLQHLDQVLPWVGPRAAAYANRIWLTGSLVPIVAVAAAGAAIIVVRARRRPAVALGLFALVAVAASVPRNGPQHLAETAPIFLAVAAGSVGLLAPALSARPAARVLTAILAVWLGIAVVAVGWRAVESFPHEGESLRGLPHLTGALSSTRTRRNARVVGESLHAAGAGTVFIVRPDAGFYYLVDDLRDPTPYDFPGVSDLGADDQDGVIRLLERGSVRWVCVPPPPARGTSVSPTRPLRLEAYVRRHYVRVGIAHSCTLYRLPAGGPTTHR
jgi:hypothetical protein